MRIIGARATATALPFDRLIEALRARLAGGCEVPPRHVHQPDEGMTSLIMPAWVPGGAYAVKIVNIAPGNAARGLPGLHSTVLLHDGATGRWRRQGLDAQAVVLLERAAADADIVSCATLSTTPVIQGAWLRAGSHLDLIGSFTRPCARPTTPASAAPASTSTPRRRWPRAAICCRRCPGASSAAMLVRPHTP